MNGQTERRMTKLMSAFRNFPKAPQHVLRGLFVGVSPNLARCYCENLRACLSTAAIMASSFGVLYTVRTLVCIKTAMKLRILKKA